MPSNKTQPIQKKDTIKIKKHFLFKFKPIAVITLLISGFFIRIVPTFHSNVFFWFDQGLDILLTKNLLVDHNIRLVGRYGGLAGVLLGPLWNLLLAIPFILTGGSPIGEVIFFSGLSILFAALTYKLISDRFGAAAGLITLLLILFSPYFIFTAQVVSSPNPLSFVFVLFVYFLYELVQNNKTKNWIFLGILLGICFQLEIAFAIFTLPAVFVVLASTGSLKKVFSRNFLIGVVVFFITFIPQGLFDLRHNFLITKSLLNFFGGGSNSLYNLPDPIQIRAVSRLNSLFEDITTMVVIVKPPVLAYFWLALSAVGWVVVIIKKQAKEIILLKILLGTIVAFYVGFTLYPGTIWEWYRAGLPIVFALLIAIPFAAIWNKNIFGKIIIAMLLLVFAYQGIKPQSIINEIRGIEKNDTAFLSDQERAIDYVYSRANGRPFSYFAYTPPIYDYVWQYDFWWYGKNKYGYTPTNLGTNIPLLEIGTQSPPPREDQGLFFAIAEPNRERPWEVDGWFKSFIKVGRVISSKKFPGYIIVQERNTND